MENLRNTTVTTGVTTSTELSPEYVGQGAQRAAISITNLEAQGGNDLFISIGQEAKANQGIKLAPGATWVVSLDSGYKPPNQQINGYAAAAINVAIFEQIFMRY